MTTRHAPPSSRRGAHLGAAPNATRAAAAGWRSPLAAFVSAALLVEGATGLWLFLAPFSVASQVQVLVHTAVGTLLVVPLVVYTGRHVATWWRQTATVVMVLGYALGVFVLVTVVSGVALTLEAALGPRRGDLWVLLHQAGGLGTLALVVGHVALAWVRRKPAAHREPALGAGARAFTRRVAAGLGATAALLTGLAVLWQPPSPEFPVPEGYALSSYVEASDEYRGNPFAPTYARTDSDTLVRPDVLAGSASCGTTGCHEEIYAEWAPSAHRFSASNPPFLQVQHNFAAERGAAETRYCAGCHDPISLFAGAKDIHDQDLAAPGMQEGCSCVVCHSISAADERGNADYVLTPPVKYLWEDTSGLTKWISDFLIRAYPQQHLEDYDRNILRTPQFCAACHKQFIPEELNRFGVSPGQNQYDEWKNSHWRHEGDAEQTLSCRDCHMRLVSGSQDPGRGEAGDVRRSADDGAHRHHGMIATNVLMPELMKLPGWERHVALTREWIRGDTVLPEIAHLWPEGPVASVDVVAPEAVAPRQEAAVRVVVTNRKVGHNFSTGPLDFIRAWLRVTATDADGTILGRWGHIDPETRRIHDTPGVPHEVGNSRSEGTMVLEGMPLDETGMPLARHELWKKAGGKGQRVIFPGYADNQVYRFVVPEGTRGPVTFRAELCFRRYRQEFLDLVVPTMEEDHGVFQPTVVQAVTERAIPVEPR